MHSAAVSRAELEEANRASPINSVTMDLLCLLQQTAFRFKVDERVRLPVSCFQTF